MKARAVFFTAPNRIEIGDVRVPDPADNDVRVQVDYSGISRESYGITRNTSRWDWYKASFEKSIVAYLDSVEAGNPPPIPGEWGLRELQVEAGIRRSIRERRSVTLEEELPLGERADA